MITAEIKANEIVYTIIRRKSTFTSWSSPTPSSISLTSPGHISSQIVASVTVVGSSVHEGGSGCINRSIPRVREGATVDSYSVQKWALKIKNQETVLYI